MKIGILGAMDQEVALLQARLENISVTKWAHLSFFQGTLHGVDVVLVKCGIGKVASAVAATALINQFSPDYVVNTGSAGGFDKSLSIGYLFIGTEFVHHDVDITHFGYALGQMAGMPETFYCDEALITAAQAAVEKQQLNLKYVKGLICTGDAFIGSDEAAMTLRTSFPKVAASEMEGAAIGQTCFMLNVPFVIIRSLSDIAGKASTILFNKYIETASENSATLVIGMIEQLKERITE